MKKLLVCICCLCLVFSATACGIAARPKDDLKPDMPVEAPTQAPSKTEFNIGETWSVDGLWTLTILGATETEERNQFSDKNPAAVYIVDYVYTNDGYDDGIMDGLYMSIDSMIVDSAGKMGYSYPGSITNYPQETPVGATCYAQACIAVDNPGTFKLSVSEYDADYEKYSADFIVDPSLPHVEYSPQAGAANNAKALKIGETWTVDGLWSLTITGVHATDERNQFSDQNPAAVYVVDYTYTNIGYEDEIMDVLYMTVADMIVDASGKMGYSYPGSVTNYPQETPVGASCNAQACIGVDTAGTFILTVSEYDKEYNKYSQTFMVEVQ